MPHVSLTFTHKFPLFPQVYCRKGLFAMYYIMLAHKVVGTFLQFSKGLPVVTNVTQITNNVPLLLTYYQGTCHYPFWHSHLTDRRRQHMLYIPNPKDPGSRGEKYITRECGILNDGNKVDELCWKWSRDLRLYHRLKFQINPLLRQYSSGLTIKHSSDS